MRWLHHRRINGRWVTIVRPTESHPPHLWQVQPCLCSPWAAFLDRLREAVGLSSR